MVGWLILRDVMVIVVVVETKRRVPNKWHTIWKKIILVGFALKKPRFNSFHHCPKMGAMQLETIQEEESMVVAALCFRPYRGFKLWYTPLYRPISDNIGIYLLKYHYWTYWLIFLTMALTLHPHGTVFSSWKSGKS